MLDKQSLIQRLKELPFPEGEYWVVAGGTLLADKLEQQGNDVSRCDDGSRKIAYSEDIELFENWLEGKVEVIGGVPVVCVDGLIQMKRKLGKGLHLHKRKIVPERPPQYDLPFVLD